MYHECGEVSLSIEVTRKIAEGLDVSLDYLSGKTDIELDSATLGRIMEMSVMPEDDKNRYSLCLCLMHSSGITRLEKPMHNKHYSSIR
ncbi:MAG: hypothetical protein ACTIKE_15290 [Sphingobacterium sp.]